MQYGGQWSAAGAMNCGAEELAGQAFVSVGGGDEVAWDISALSRCSSGASCPPVTIDFNSVYAGETGFRVPECEGAQTTVTQTRGRGQVSAPVHPSAGNGYRGEIELNDNAVSGESNGPDIYEASVTVSCPSGSPSGSATAHYRLACANTIGTGTCHQGRIETLNPYTQQWGSVCGHRIWNSDVVAHMVCTSLGFQSGSIYTYGSSQSLPQVPIVAGFRDCAGSEASIFDCPVGGSPLDAAGTNGVDPTCTHSIDQGAICSNSRTSGRTNPGIAACSGCKFGCAAVAPTQYPAIFGCTDYYTAQCHYDVSNAEVAGCATCGSYTRALRAFAQCVETTATGMVGYCHGALGTTAHLANSYVCEQGMNTNSK